jgi:hypothetical protein
LIEIVIVVVAALAVGRRRWLKRQPGEFAGEEWRKVL